MTYSDSLWDTLAMGAITNVPRGLEFSTDLLWEKVPHPASPTKMGNILTAAAAKGLIRSTGKYEPSRRPACHGRIVKVWVRL